MRGKIPKYLMYFFGIVIILLIFYNISLQKSLKETREALETAESKVQEQPSLPPPLPEGEECLPLFEDSDGDNWGSKEIGEEVCGAEEIPFGFTTQKGDCDDSNSSVWVLKDVYQDKDGDGFSTNLTVQICTNNQAPAGFLAVKTEPLDCNDKSDITYPGSDWPETADSPDYNCDGYRDLPAGAVFVTEKKYNGNLGGLSGADKKCQAEAEASDIKLAGNWQAILSTSTTDAVDRLPDTEYVTSLRGLIAENKTELFRGFVNARIRYTENGGTSSELVWTGTGNDGKFSSGLGADMSTCGDWTKPLDRGIVGSTTASTNWKWINNGNSNCESLRALYCVRVS